MDDAILALLGIACLVVLHGILALGKLVQKRMLARSPHPYRFQLHPPNPFEIDYLRGELVGASMPYWRGPEAILETVIWTLIFRGKLKIVRNTFRGTVLCRGWF